MRAVADALAERRVEHVGVRVRLDGVARDGREGGQDAQEEAYQVEARRLDDDHGLGRRRCLGAEGHARAAFYAFAVDRMILLVRYGFLRPLAHWQPAVAKTGTVAPSQPQEDANVLARLASVLPLAASAGACAQRLALHLRAARVGLQSETRQPHPSRAARGRRSPVPVGQKKLWVAAQDAIDAMAHPLCLLLLPHHQCHEDEEDRLETDELDLPGTVLLLRNTRRPRGKDWRPASPGAPREFRTEGQASGGSLLMYFEEGANAFPSIANKAFTELSLEERYAKATVAYDFLMVDGQETSTKSRT